MRIILGDVLDRGRPEHRQFFALEKAKMSQGNLMGRGLALRPVRGNVRRLSCNARQADFYRLHQGLTGLMDRAAHAKRAAATLNSAKPWAGSRIL
ncbi:MAG: hypothetical protein H0U98_09165 [Alphaproteobacteria bacterium]|nr:hypothetical protein [Alphaproteobacteria bacterium]